MLNQWCCAVFHISKNAPKTDVCHNSFIYIYIHIYYIYIYTHTQYDNTVLIMKITSQIFKQNLINVDSA